MKTLTIEMAKSLRLGDVLITKRYFNADGTHRRLRVTGKPRTWKRNLNRVEVPVKHGLRGYGLITEHIVSEYMI